MPVIIHDREAHEDTIRILEEYKPKGILHRYSGPVDVLKRAFDLGMYISFNNDLTYPMWNAGPIACLMETPWDRLLIETDCPYMAPEPNRGKRCDSSMLHFVAQKMADELGLTKEEIIRITNENAKKAVDVLKELKGSEAHATVILSQIDRDTFRKLGINLTCEPHHESKKLYHK